MIRRVPTLTAVLLVFLAACTDFVTIPSDNPGPPSPRFSESDGGAVVLGSSTISAPSSSWTQVSAIPVSQWVVVDVKGTTNYTKNPACELLAPYWRWTNFPLHGLSAGPLQGPVIVRVGTGPNSYNYLYPVNGTTQTATHARMLMFVTTPGTSVGAYTTGGVGSCGDPTSGIYHKGYFVSGSHEITVTQIPAPIEINAPERVGKNEVAHFSVQPYGDLRWLNPPGAGVPEGRRAWYYLAGDTVEGGAPYPGQGQFISHCWTEPVCEYKPEVSGRMRVAAYVEGRYATWKSPIVRVVDSELKLTCSDTVVVRGSGMTCTAEAKPSGTLTDIQWEFVDSAGRVNPGPTGTSWGGRMVVGGQMRVRALLNGDSTAAAATIRIRSRTWPSLRIAERERNPNHLPPPDRVRRSQDLGDAHVDSLPSYPGARINDGPNEGWWYVDRPLPDIPVLVDINYPAFQAGSAWYNLQRPGIWTNPATGTQHPHCRRADVPRLLTLTRQHEGSLSSSGGQVSHVDAMRAYLATNAPQDFFEALLATDVQTATQPFDELMRVYYRWKIIGDLTGVTQHKPAGQTDLAVFPCMPRYF